MRNRRDILIGASCAALAVPLSRNLSFGQSPIVRREFSEFQRDPGALQALRDAVDVLRRRDDYGNRPSLDGWFALATNHNNWCFRSQPELEIHFGWWFFPWHRAYLIHIEKTLQQVINEPSLRLPYWNWVDMPRLPKAFTEPTYRNGGQTLRNPLFDETRFGPVGTGAEDLDYEQLGAPNQNERDLVAYVTFEQFGGGQQTPARPRRPGALENTTHNYVHVAVGLEDEPGDRVGHMGTGMSPLDPIFMLHHANVDRLWKVWLSQGAQYQNPPENAWSNHLFVLKNIGNANVTEYKIAELLNTESSAGNYRYDRERLLESMRVASNDAPKVNRFEIPEPDIRTRGVPGLGPAPQTDGKALQVPDSLREALGKSAPNSAAAIILGGIPIPDKPTTFRAFAQPDGSSQRILLGAFSILPTPDKDGKTDIVIRVNAAARTFFQANKNIAVRIETAGRNRAPVNFENIAIEIPQ